MKGQYLGSGVDKNFPATKEEIESWDINEWAANRFDRLGMWYEMIKEQHKTYRKVRNVENHPWYGRAERAIARAMNSLREQFEMQDEPEMPLDFPDVVIDMGWVKDRLDELTKENYELCNFAVRNIRVWPHWLGLGNTAKQAIDNEVYTMQKLLDKSFAPEDSMVQAQVDRVEEIVVILASGHLSFNESLQRELKGFRTSMNALQRAYYEKAREHDLNWEVGNWGTDRFIPRVDKGYGRAYWYILLDLGYKPYKELKENPWWKGNDPDEFYWEKVMPTDIMKLREERLEEIDEVLESIAGRHWSVFRSLLLKERNTWNKLVQGAAVNSPKALPPSTEEIRELRMSLFPHWRVYNVEKRIQRADMTLLCRTDTPWKHANCNRLNEGYMKPPHRSDILPKRCLCGCHLRRRHQENLDMLNKVDNDSDEFGE